MTSDLELHTIFGTGPLGQAVMRELLARGKQIRMVNRSGQANVPQGVEVVAADAYDPTSTKAVTAGSTVVYQCAQPAYTEWPQKFPPLQAAIVAGVAANGAKLIVGDNLYMYGLVNTPLKEDLPNAAITRKGRTRARMAEELLAAHQKGQIRVAIGRSSDFFGPLVLGSLVGERVFPAILAGKSTEGIGNIDLPHTYTFISDFGKALVVLGEKEEALGQIWHVPNAETVTTRQFLEIAFAEAGHPPKIKSMGKLMMQIAGLFIPEAKETVEMMYEFEHPFIVDSRKYIQAFGNHATPLKEALRQTLDWYRQADKH
ncbi:SDR family oxidoreductase [Merismopedia glauca]|uniref:NAD-dependent dehydratase n=1 Tax=Merismopedia glauca CCAP 1448/3 TaxID=1296344 RepID=A0A2T1C6S5_9CYAN|nr:SDR family oxidoreductase [Merismopedia glauca]PSB03934.1 NAD-dependent dehydratase [Merismopedia glauca CCAP 1448/3]